MRNHPARIAPYRCSAATAAQHTPHTMANDYTHEELCKKPLSELRQMRSALVKDYQALVSFNNRTDAAIKPVVYMTLKSEDPPLYSVGTARCAMRIPGFKTHEDDNYTTEMSYTMLPNPFMSDEDLTEIGERLKEALKPFKMLLPGTDESVYWLSHFKVWQWLDYAAALGELKNNKDPLRVGVLRQKISKRLRRAHSREDDDYEDNDEDENDAHLDVTQPINEKAAAAEKEKKEEMKKIAEFVKERLVRLDQAQSADAPPLQKDDIVAMYRIWAHGINLQSSARIVEYMQTAFSAQPVYTSASDSALAYKGFALKTDDWVYVAPNNQPVNIFLRDECVFSFKAKTFTKTIFDAYADWYGKSGYPAMQKADLKREIRAILNTREFVFSAILAIKGVSTCGWYGVALRSDAAAAASPSEKPAVLKRASIVERRIPGPGGALLGSWPSLSKACTSLKIGLCKLKTLIANQTPDKDGAIIVLSSAGADGASTSA